MTTTNKSARTKAQEFEELAAAAMAAPWRVARTPGADDGYSGLTIEALYDCIAYNVATPKTADFIAWCGTNRDLIIRALRRDEPFTADVIDRIAHTTGLRRDVVIDVLAGYRTLVP